MKNNSTFYIIVIIFLSIAVFFLTLPIPLIQNFLIINDYLAYLIPLIAGLALGYLCCLFIDSIVHKEKKEILAGIIIPIPTMVFLYSYILFMKTVNLTISQIGETSIFGAVTVNPIIFSWIFFLGFNTPFLYFFYKKHEKKALLAYYMIAPVLFILALVIINVLLEYVV